MLITVSGRAGTGTTTLARILSKELNVPHVYAGAIFRDMARERGMSLAEFGRYAEEHHEVDMELDQRMVEVAEREHGVLEGRLAAWHATRGEVSALKVLLTASERTRAKRIQEREGTPDIQDVLEQTREREASETKRYRELYDIDPYDEDLYDVVVDTEDLTPEEVAERVLRELPEEADEEPVEPKDQDAATGE